jgi:hypothetical protein
MPLDSRYVSSCSVINFSNILETDDRTEIGREIGSVTHYI